MRGENMPEQIIAVYVGKLNGLESYVYTTKSDKDPLKYSYYLLTINVDGSCIKEPLKNAIEILTKEGFKVVSVPLGSEQYIIFLEHLNNAQPKNTPLHRTAVRHPRLGRVEFNPEFGKLRLKNKNGS